MIRNLKTMGLALMAVLALGAMAASAAQAEGFGEATIEGGGTATVTGTQTGATLNEFEIPAGITECTNASFTATVANGATEVTTNEPSYSGCTTAGQTSSVNFTGCNYTLTPSTTITGGKWTDTVDLVCPSGKHVDIVVPSIGCEITVFPKNNLSHIIWENSGGAGSAMDVKITPTVSGIEWTIQPITGEECLIESVPDEHGANGVYRGAITVTAKVGGVTKGVTLSHTP